MKLYKCEKCGYMSNEVLENKCSKCGTDTGIRIVDTYDEDKVIYQLTMDDVDSVLTHYRGIQTEFIDTMKSIDEKEMIGYLRSKLELDWADTIDYLLEDKYNFIKEGK